MSRGLGRIQQAILNHMREAALRHSGKKQHYLRELVGAAFSFTTVHGKGRRSVDARAGTKRAIIRLEADGLIVRSTKVETPFWTLPQ